MQQRPPPRAPQNRKRTAIGCGTAILLFLMIGSCNAIISHGRGIDTLITTQSSGPIVVATRRPPETTTTGPTHVPAATNVLPAPTPVPTAVPTDAPAPTTPPVTLGVNGNPWGYDFTMGNLIYSPPADFCEQYFSCVSTFWKDTNGYVAQCVNGVFTHSGGVRGACSRDDGVGQILYSH
jgi:hypothetical protein